MSYFVSTDFDGGDGIEAYRISNPSILLCTSLRAALDVSLEPQPRDMDVHYMSIIVQCKHSKQNNSHTNTENVCMCFVVL